MGPFRIVVFGESQTVKHARVKGKKREYVRKVERQGYGFILWNPDEATAAKAGRPGFGSFEWLGMHVARRAALDVLMQPEIMQVSIRTNQDKQIARLYRCRLAEYVGQFELPLKVSLAA